MAEVSTLLSNPQIKAFYRRVLSLVESNLQHFTDAAIRFTEGPRQFDIGPADHPFVKTSELIAHLKARVTGEYVPLKGDSQRLTRTIIAQNKLDREGEHRSDGESDEAWEIRRDRQEKRRAENAQLLRDLGQVKEGEFVGDTRKYDRLPMKGITVQRNAERYYFVSHAEAAKVLAACPDAEWQLIFALSRFGGLRCPSEHMALRWIDVDYANWTTMTVQSPKTAHQGKASRVVPIFPELRPFLQEAWEAAPEGAEYVIRRHRGQNANLRTQLQRIMGRAGVKPWPKLFQNLRSSRQTELAERYPIQVVCEWIGNSEAVAAKHYLQVTEDHVASAINTPTIPMHQLLQTGTDTSGQTQTDEQAKPAIAVTPDDSRGCEWWREDSNLGPQPYQGCALTN